MEKQASLMLGGLIAALALAGFVKKDKHAMGLMNVDVAHSVLRVPVATALLYGGNPRTSTRITRSILLGAGAVYLAIGAVGLFDRRAGGLLPSRLTNFDLGYPVVGGLLAIGLALYERQAYKRVIDPSRGPLLPKI